jgi:hypothetical protein
VNKYQKDQNLPSLTTDTVTTCIRNLKPEVQRIGVNSQGSKVVNSAWCKARYNWNTQLLIWFGLLDSVPDAAGVVQPWFDQTKLTPIAKTQVGWFDETHTKCTIGGQKADTLKRHVVRFPRDKHGKLDMQAGAYDETGACHTVSMVDKERNDLLV